MKVVRNTPDQLIVSDTPWVIGMMLILFILAFGGAGLLVMTKSFWPGLLWVTVGPGMGIFAFVVFVRRVQVLLDRASNRIVIRRQSVFRYQSVEHPLDELETAVLETTARRSKRTGSHSELTRPVLVFARGMSAGRHSVVEAYSSGRGSRLLVDAINGWLRQGDGHALDSPPAAT